MLTLVKCRYMRGRLTLEKVNAAVNDMATYAEANAHLISAPKKKVMIQFFTTLLFLVIGPYICTYCFTSSCSWQKISGKEPW